MMGSQSAPPLARGWTPLQNDISLKTAGSPARAGMDPNNQEPKKEKNRLPRSRGDGPRTIEIMASEGLAPPLARGWTLVRQYKAASVLGSPARAGMDPRTAAENMKGCRLPRSRGDGPELLQGYSRTAEAPPLARGWTPEPC